MEMRPVPDNSPNKAECEFSASSKPLKLKAPTVSMAKNQFVRSLSTPSVSTNFRNGGCSKGSWYKTSLNAPKRKSDWV